MVSNSLTGLTVKMNNLKEKIVQDIKKEMNGRKMTTSCLARELGVSRSQVADALTQDKASLERLLKIAEFFFGIEIKLKKKTHKGN